MDWGTLKDTLQEKRLFQSRVMVAVMMVFAIFLILGARLYQLQIVETQTYTTLSDRNRVQVQPVPPTRGLIYDRNGQLLAENRPVFSLTVLPERVSDMPALLAQLQEIVRLNPQDIERFERRLRERRRPFETVPVRFHLDEGEMARLAVNRHRLPGVEVDAQLVRSYPYGELTSHVLGYVGRINQQDVARLDRVRYAGTHYTGKSGIEREYEDLLHGNVGYQNVETNARGRVMRVLEEKGSQPGQHLQLNLDIRLQQVAHAAMGSRRGAVVAIEPSTGAILAQVSTPSFDANQFVTGIDHESYGLLRDSLDVPLFNRATRGQYPPGSVIKPMLGLVGLATGTVEMNTTIFDRGWYQLPNSTQRFRNWDRGGMGRVNLHDSIVRSNDTFFYKMGHDMGIDQMSQHLAQFGFGRVTSLDVRDERPGILPSREWKRSVRGESWFPGDSVNMSIGQGYFLSTPLQLAAVTATTANRGTWRSPRHLKSVNDAPHGETLMADTDILGVTFGTREQWEYIVDSMEDVVHGRRGTARSIARGLDYRIAGKTGTSQVFSLAGEEYDEEEIKERMRDHALFVAFAPADDPKIAVAVLVENGGSGGATAAPVARQVMDAWINGFPEVLTGEPVTGAGGAL
ncbi:MAG: penicillin-binding protein 2 [Halomonadaceae bacterium]|nr:MAG: penicillin-binding protein 2 [Halomonadaceae bacterium]